MSSANLIRILQPIYGGSFATDTAAATDSAALATCVLPGELIRTDPQLEILQPSPDRTVAACRHFGACGGCHYMHASYPAQLDLKRDILKGLLAGAGLKGLPEIRTEASPEWHYRNRIRVRVEPAGGGRLRAGYNVMATRRFLPIDGSCPISAPVLWRSINAMLALAVDEEQVRRWLAVTSELELFCTPDEAQLQLQFLLRATDASSRDDTAFSRFCERLRSVVPELTGAGALLDPELNRRARRQWAGAAWGARGLNYPVAGRRYWVPRGAFFQVNRFMIDRLVNLVTGGQAGRLAWDLYAGVGLFTRALAESFTEVVAVEGADAAVVGLRSACKGFKGAGAVETVQAATLDFLRARELQRERPELIVLDPPRAGLGPEGSPILARIAAPRVIYISCDPTSLARDLAIMTRGSYRVDSLVLVDLFPQTYHMETVVHLSRL